MMKFDVFNFPEDVSAIDYVRKCEDNFNEQLKKICYSVAEDRDIRAITLSGPTCSGKTTASDRLITELNKLGRKAKLISIDDFYRSRDELKKLGITDVEGVSAIDTELFAAVANDLVNLRCTKIPKYDFVTKSRPYAAEYTPDINDVYIFEGIQAVYPEVLACLADFSSVSVFINICEDMYVKNTLFEKNDIRLIRRIVRDYYHRDASVEYTMGLWENVRLNEEKNIFPYADSATFKINSLIPYEIFILGKDYLRLTADYTDHMPYHSLITDIRKRLSSVISDDFVVSMIPDDSLLREFIA